MVETPLRPVFTEGQVLGAADLNAGVEHDRARAARHERYLHEWGIADGLTLRPEKRTDPLTGPFVEVTLLPGMAVDGTGRDVVVAEPVTLQEAAFAEVNDADTPGPDPYPVFLAGLDVDRPDPSLAPAGCGGAGGTRTEESFQVVYGRIGDERTLADEVDPGVAAGPGDGSRPWRVLLGYVVWDGTHFTAVEQEARGVGRRYAGVRADTVVARSGTLALRPDPAVTAGRPAVVLDGDAGLTFGRLRSDGSLERLVAASTDGDLFVAGTLTTQLRSGQTAVVSGTATTGMILPLPAGVTAEQVAAGKVQVHARVVPRLTRSPQLPPGVHVIGAVECEVDAQRRVRSLVEWVAMDGGSPVPVRLPAPADFLVVATVAAEAAPSPGSAP